MNLTAKSSLAFVLSATMMLNWNTAAAEDELPVTPSSQLPAPVLLAEDQSSPEPDLNESDADISAAEDVAEIPEDARLPLKELRLFAEIFNNIRTSYVETVDDKTLLQNAIRGMLSGLDPHSAYLDSKVFEELQINTSGEFGGLGIEVQMDNGFVRVVTPIDETPAFRAGLKSGDLIMKLDEKPVKGMSLDDAIKHMRGEPGSDIVLTVLREGEEQPLEFTVTRDVIKVTSVRHRWLEDGYAYVRISQFQVQTGEDLNKAIVKLQKDGQELKGLVLDLRNNPGGVLQASVDVVDTFLTNGLVVYTEGRINSSKSQFHATPKDLINGAPIVVLINGGSASASEIVAGALQDHRRAIIMGTQSFGKGSVQTVIPVDAENGIKLTTARYYTPNGRSIQAQGIEPDINIERAKVETIKPRARYKEADLAGHLENENGDDKKEDNEEKLAEKDYQLSEALNVLKGFNILSSNE
ncbi:S41 family peptidase [Litoribacillus peritrichatus]|uniref:Proteolytic complex protein CptA n=1 Tax=Litoribacillus peritrichatus TaxID=718191 RepID=A0ABP7MW18_9GAMM